jgi:hypothetical protein
VSNIDVVDLFMSLGEVTLWFFGLFLLIGLFGRLENLIYETLESVAIPGLVLSLRVEDTNAILDTLKFTQPRSVLLIASRPLHIVNRMILLPRLVVTLGQARLVHVT